MTKTIAKKRQIAAGGQGEVWLGEMDGERVAIKYLKIATAFGSESDLERKRFKREIKCQRDLQHVGIMPVLGFNVTADPPFLVMPFAEGSLRDTLKLQPDGLTEEQALELFTKILKAIKFAHDNDVLHRDIKPENILFLNNEPMLSDFGLGRRLHSGSTTITVAHVGMGTLQYAAPEQLSDGHTVDVRADVFSLGRVFYEMLSGCMAYPVMDLQLVPARFRHIIMRSTHIKPDRRYPSVALLLKDVKLLSLGVEHFRTPAQRVSSIIASFGDNTEGPTDVAALTRILVEHSDDRELYVESLVRVPGRIISAMSVGDPEAFHHIVHTFDGFADDRFPFEDTDAIADLLGSFFEATLDIEIRSTALTRLLVLATIHNRYYVRTKFVTLAHQAMGDPTYVPILVSMIHDNESCKDFVRDQLSERSLPAILAEALAA